MYLRQFLFIYIKFLNTYLYTTLIVVFERRSSLFLISILNGHSRSDHLDLEFVSFTLTLRFSTTKKFVTFFLKDKVNSFINEQDKSFLLTKDIAIFLFCKRLLGLN